MGLHSTHSEIDELPGGVIRHTIAIKAIAYRESGILKPLVQDWEDSGNGTTPHIASRAPLRVRTANDGMRRIFPIHGDDSYIELGTPFVKIAGIWTRLAVGQPARAKGRLTWTRPNFNMYIDHGGHFSKLSILLKNGFVPEDSMIAFPVNINGLTRVGNEIQSDGVPVLQLRSLHVEDLDNPFDIRPITHQFTNLNGQPYMLCTLPSLTGMGRPLIDPTLTLQPNASDGIDALITLRVSDTNFGTISAGQVGELNITSGGPDRILIKFDVSSIPVAATITSSTLSLYALTDYADNANTSRAFRQKRAWVETQVTWDNYSTGNIWQTAGGFGSNDCEQTDIGSRAFAASEALNVFKDWTLSNAGVQGWTSGTFTNNGLLVKTDAELNDAYAFALSDHATAAFRPKLEVVYSAGGLIYQRRMDGLGAFFRGMDS